MQQAGSRGSGTPAGPRLPQGASNEVALFINGRRSIYDIYLGVRAEFGQVTTGSNEWKFAYVVTPETADVDIEAVAAQIRMLEAADLVQIGRIIR